MLSSKTLARLRKESTAAERIPYAAQVAEHVVRTFSGDYVQVFRLGGASFESQDDVEVNSWHERLNVLWRNIASPNVAVWTHIIRRREESYPQGVFSDAFSAALNARYRERLAGERLMANELYLALSIGRRSVRQRDGRRRSLRAERAGSPSWRATLSMPARS